jgi:hypothetical protein
MNYKEYELFVGKYFQEQLNKRFGEIIPVLHQKDLIAPDGNEYNIDLHYTFKIGNVEYLTIIECKHWNTSISRDLVLTLDSKRNSLKAHKAIMVTSKGFQSGAISFAKTNSIGLFKVTQNGDIQTFSNFAGNYDDYCKRLTEKTNINQNGKFINGFGIISPRISIQDYLKAKYNIDIKDLLIELREPEEMDNNDYLPNIPDNWIDDYEKVETCGLDLILENEMSIRQISIMQLMDKIKNKA